MSPQIGKAQTQSSHPLTPLSTHAAPSQTHTCHIPHQLLSSQLDTIPEPRVPTTCPALTTTTPHPSSIPALPSTRTVTLSQHTHMQHYTHHSHSNHRIHIGYDNLTGKPKDDHRPNSKSERNLIILQININGIKNSRSSNCLSTTHMQISSQFRKPSSP